MQTLYFHFISLFLPSWTAHRDEFPPHEVIDYAVGRASFSRGHKEERERERKKSTVPRKGVVRFCLSHRGVIHE